MKNELPATLTHVFERKEHPYYMWEGIQSIPAGMEEFLAPQAGDAIRQVSATMYPKPMIHLTGCGTSYFAALAIAYAIQQLASRPAFAWEAFEFLAYPPAGIEDSAVVGISHTGGTPPVVHAVEMARRKAACTVSYTDGNPSALTRASEWTIPSRMGTERALPKTRSYVSALLRGYLQAIELARLDGKAVAAWEVALQRAPELARQVIAAVEPQAQQLAGQWAMCRRVIVSGGGPQFATAQEGMLKLTEAGMFSSIAWEIEEAVHGTWASTLEEDLLILLAMEGPSYESAVRLAGGLKRIDAKVWVITNRPWAGVAVDALTELPAGDPEIFMPSYAILPIYEFSYFAALAKHISPDNMRLSDPRFLEARSQMRSSLG